MDLRIQELGGYGVFRFLDNLFNAFEALFDRSGLIGTEEERIIESTRKISKVSLTRENFLLTLNETKSKASSTHT